MNMQTALKIKCHLEKIIAAADQSSDLLLHAMEAHGLIGGELLKLGWKNDTADLPAMAEAEDAVAETMRKYA